MREGLIRKTSVALAALSLLLFLTAAFALTDRAPQAEAADSETAALIGYFNQYRTSHGAGALSASINAYAQSQAQKVISDCGYTYSAGGYSVIWATYGYGTAQDLWSAYQSDSTYLGYIGRAQYHSAGVGRAYGCDWGWVWVIVLDTSGGGGATPTPTPSNTPSPTPSKTPSPTPSKTPTPRTSLTPTPTTTATQSPAPTSPAIATDTPTATPDCLGASDATTFCVSTPTPTPTPTPEPTATPSPVVTEAPELPGDSDCDLDVDSEDGIHVLMGAAGFLPLAPCLNLQGVNCKGGVDIADVLAIISYLGHIPYALPVGCPPLGLLITPVPTPVPTPSPTPTPAPVPTETPGPTDPVPTGTTAVTPTEMPSTSETPAPSVGAGAINQCQLALVSYQLDTDLLAGELHCIPTGGTTYDCYFGNVNATCASSSGYPDYDCAFSAQDVADCTPQSGEPEYQCYRNTPGAVECMPSHVGYPTYECAIDGGTVTCTTTDAPSPNFACAKQAVDFDCVAQP